MGIAVANETTQGKVMSAGQLTMLVAPTARAAGPSDDALARFAPVPLEHPAPNRVQCEVTSYCNMLCPFCSYTYRDRERDPDQHMDLALFQKIVNECRDYLRNGWPVYKLYLYGVGEPLLYKHFAEALEYSRDVPGEPHLSRGLSTNCMALTERKAQQLLDAELDEVILSCDSIVKEEYEKLRVGGVLETVLENIDRFLTMRKARGKFTEKTYVQTMAFWENRNSFVDAAKFWLAKIDGMPNTVAHMKQVGHWPSIKARPLAPGEGGPQGRDIPAVEFVDVDNFAGMPGMEFIGRHDFKEIARHPQLSWVHEKREIRPTCNLWDTSITVLASGAVNQCCQDGNDSLKLANVKNQTMLEIWRGSQWQRYRTLFKHGRFDAIPLCKDCR